ncbi:MAG: hypothetical protein LBP31_00870 [Holosporales bacterium]|jgi:hypothetical protein|nr:hypothetical protein [Holosporales bacterium]
MNNKQYILKIENSKNQILLSSIRASEELSTLDDFKIIRSINDEPINVGQSTKTKYKLIVKTKDSPDVSIATIGELFKIYSTVRLKCHKNSQNQFQKVQESLENVGDYVTFRPVFSMYLTDCKIANNDKESGWTLKFEEG